MQEQLPRIAAFIRSLFPGQEFVSLHAPYFGGNEKKYVLDTIDSTFVSSVGAYVNRFEEMMAGITGARFAIATTNGTTALHLALMVAGVRPGDEVLTQPLTFVATANAIAHAGAEPIFTDVDMDTLGLSPDALEEYLSMHAFLNDEGMCIHKKTGRKISACVPMHTFGFPCRIQRIVEICDRYNIPVVEDAAESLGSYAGSQHTGTFGLLGTFSFNGNKTVTCGGGGAVVTNDERLAALAKHLSTTAKIPHRWEFVHDLVGYNYRLPNLNAALACAQLEQLDLFLENKSELADCYHEYFAGSPIRTVKPLEGDRANYWLNTIIMPSEKDKVDFLSYTNDNGVMTRPIWQLMNRLPAYAHCHHGSIGNAEWLAERIVNIPSSYRPKA